MKRSTSSYSTSTERRENSGDLMERGEARFMAALHATMRTLHEHSVFPPAQSGAGGFDLPNSGISSNDGPHSDT